MICIEIVPVSHNQGVCTCSRRRPPSSSSLRSMLCHILPICQPSCGCLFILSIWSAFTKQMWPTFLKCEVFFVYAYREATLHETCILYEGRRWVRVLHKSMDYALSGEFGTSEQSANRDRGRMFLFCHSILQRVRNFVKFSQNQWIPSVDGSQNSGVKIVLLLWFRCRKLDESEPILRLPSLSTWRSSLLSRGLFSSE